MIRVYYGKEITDEIHEKAAKLLYECFAKNSGTYIKIGQMIGQLDLLVPEKYVEIFEPMCQEAPTTDWEDVKTIVEEELGRPMEEVFDKFEYKPIGSASLA